MPRLRVPLMRLTVTGLGRVLIDLAICEPEDEPDLDDPPPVPGVGFVVLDLDPDR